VQRIFLKARWCFVKDIVAAAPATVWGCRYLRHKKRTLPIRQGPFGSPIFLVNQGISKSRFLCSPFEVHFYSLMKLIRRKGFGDVVGSPELYRFDRRLHASVTGIGCSSLMVSSNSRPLTPGIFMSSNIISTGLSDKISMAAPGVSACST